MQTLLIFNRFIICKYIKSDKSLKVSSMLEKWQFIECNGRPLRKTLRKEDIDFGTSRPMRARKANLSRTKVRDVQAYLLLFSKV